MMGWRANQLRARGKGLQHLYKLPACQVPPIMANKYTHAIKHNATQDSTDLPPRIDGNPLHGNPMDGNTDTRKKGQHTSGLNKSYGAFLAPFPSHCIVPPACTRRQRGRDGGQRISTSS